MLHPPNSQPPGSIAIIGASNDAHKPGGKLLENIIQGGYEGSIYPVNPKESNIRGLKCYADITDLPQVDLAILAIPARFCPAAVKQLSEEKECRGFIIISAGFSEGDDEGKRLEVEIVAQVNKVGGSLIGPNCIGLINQNYRGVFTTPPIPEPNIAGADLISGSGATAVFLMETGLKAGLRFNEVYSVGNSAQLGVEDILEHLDEDFDPQRSSKIKLLYMESIKDPQKLIKHASSLIRKGCRIAGIKAGSSEAGIRAASSHTGALAASDITVRALFKKAGIVYCSGRFELITVASIFNYKALEGKNIAIITHAGGSAVMLTDALEKAGLNVPALDEDISSELATYLYPGSSVGNPIDFLATGTADQLGIIIDYCEHKFDDIDAMVVVFGSAGLFDVENVYRVLDVKMDICKKPIYPVLPSLINAEKEIDYMLRKGRVNFPDEVILGMSLGEVYYTPLPSDGIPTLPEIDKEKIKVLLSKNQKASYLDAMDAYSVLEACGIPIAGIASIVEEGELLKAQTKLSFPWVMKVDGPIHKTEVKGVTLNINSMEFAKQEFRRMMAIPGAKSVLIQEMVKGIELFSGAIKEDNFGHLIMVGLGGIYIEILKDVRAGLAPISEEEALKMIRRLKSYPIIQGVRGQEGSDEKLLADVLIKLSSLVFHFPEILEIDLNPLIAGIDRIACVDVRIAI